MSTQTPAPAPRQETTISGALIYQYTAQHGDHPHAPGQRRLDLQPHEITGIIQPALSGPAAASHRGPITASSTAHELTASVITSAKSSPGSIESMSLNTRSAPR